jgi:hypothetical protein
MEWKAFKDEVPELDKLILYGNHRFVDTMRYQPTHPHLKEDAKLAYKNITHWCYIDSPPVVEEEPVWK